MAYSICLEQMEDRWIAHVPALPGCFASDLDPERALGALPDAVEAYAAWRARGAIPGEPAQGPGVVEEIARAWISEGNYEVSAFFAADRPPVRADELPEFEALLAASREDLLASVAGIDEATLLREVPGERWPLVGVLNHVANAEWWYLDRLGLSFPRAEMPSEVFERLERVRAHLLGNLERLAAFTGVVGRYGETWSARKVLRRALWHERDHTEHLGKILNQLDV